MARGRLALFAGGLVLLAAAQPGAAQVAPPLRVPPKDSIPVPVIRPVPPLRAWAENDGQADTRVRTNGVVQATASASGPGASALAIGIERDGERVRVRVPVEGRAAGELSEPFFLRDRVRLYMTVSGAPVVATPAIDPVGTSGLLAVRAVPVGDQMQIIVEAGSIRKYGMESELASVTLWLEPDAQPHGRTPSLPLPTDAVVEAALRDATATDAATAAMTTADATTADHATLADGATSASAAAAPSIEHARDTNRSIQQADNASSTDPQRHGARAAVRAWTNVAAAVSTAAQATRAGAVRTGHFIATQWTNSARARAAIADRSASLMTRARPALARNDVQIVAGATLLTLILMLRIRQVRRRRKLVIEVGTTADAQHSTKLVMAPAAQAATAAPAAPAKTKKLRLRRRRAAESSPEMNQRTAGADPRLWAARTLAGEGLDALSIARRTGLAREATALIVMDARRKVPAAAGTSRPRLYDGGGSDTGDDAIIH